MSTSTSTHPSEPLPSSPDPKLEATVMHLTHRGGQPCFARNVWVGSGQGDGGGGRGDGTTRASCILRRSHRSPCLAHGCVSACLHVCMSMSTPQGHAAAARRADRPPKGGRRGTAQRKARKNKHVNMWNRGPNRLGWGKQGVILPPAMPATCHVCVQDVPTLVSLGTRGVRKDMTGRVGDQQKKTEVTATSGGGTFLGLLAGLLCLLDGEGTKERDNGRNDRSGVW